MIAFSKAPIRPVKWAASFPGTLWWSLSKETKREQKLHEWVLCRHSLDFGGGRVRSICTFMASHTPVDMCIVAVVRGIGMGFRCTWRRFSTLDCSKCGKRPGQIQQKGPNINFMGGFTLTHWNSSSGRFHLHIPHDV